MPIKIQIQTKQLGVTIIELLIYVSLLGMLATVVFGFVWQIQRKNKKVLASHTNLYVAQVAIDLLSRDLRNSSKVITNQKNQAGLKNSSKNRIICQSSLGEVSWFLNQEHALVRLNQQAKIKKPVPAKVVEDLKSFVVYQTRLKSGAILIKLKLVQQDSLGRQNSLEKKVLLRVSMPL